MKELRQDSEDLVTQVVEDRPFRKIIEIILLPLLLPSGCRSLAPRLPGL